MPDAIAKIHFKRHAFTVFKDYNSFIKYRNFLQSEERFNCEMCWFFCPSANELSTGRVAPIFNRSPFTEGISDLVGAF